MIVEGCLVGIRRNMYHLMDFLIKIEILGTFHYRFLKEGNITHGLSRNISNWRTPFKEFIFASMLTMFRYERISTPPDL